MSKDREISQYTIPEKVGSHLILGEKRSGKTTLIKNIVKSVKPKIKVIFTENISEWTRGRERVIGKMGNEYWLINTPDTTDDDRSTHVNFPDGMEKKFEMAVKEWKKLKSERKDDQSSIMFIFDCVPWREELLKSRTFRDVLMNGRYIQMSVVIAYNPVTRIDDVSRMDLLPEDYTPQFPPDIRRDMNSIFLIGHYEERINESLYRNYFSNSTDTYKNYKTVLCALGQSEFLVSHDDRLKFYRGEN